MFWSNSGKVQICTKCISLHEISHLGPFTSIHTVTHENSQNTWAHSLGMDFQFTCLCPAIQIGKYVFSRRHTSLLIRQSIWWESLTFSNVTLNGLVWFDVLFFDLPQFIWWIVWARLTSSNVTAIFPNLTLDGPTKVAFAPMLSFAFESRFSVLFTISPTRAAAALRCHHLAPASGLSVISCGRAGGGQGWGQGGGRGWGQRGGRGWGHYAAMSAPTLRNCLKPDWKCSLWYCQPLHCVYYWCCSLVAV